MQKYLLLLIAVLFFSLAISGQKLTKSKQKELFEDVANDSKAATKCVEKAEKEYKQKYGVKLPRVSGHCFDGCPVLIPKPLYPDIAMRNNMSGEVTVEAVVDEEGNVIYAKPAKGKKVFFASAVSAAYKAKYQPKQICDGRRIKFWWRITYRFFPSM